MAETTANLPATEGSTITIPIPDDFHHHFRDGSRTKYILEHVAGRFRRCIAMPNLSPPVTTVDKALAYRKHIVDSLPDGHASTSLHDDDGSGFIPLMTLYLTDNTLPSEIEKAHGTGHIPACKYYPAGATTNSAHGVTDAKKIYPALRAMEKCGMVLCIHSEVSRAEVDIFDRETVFIEEIITPLVAEFPNLKIVMEHISTKEAVDYVNASNHPFLRASITAHHLLYNRNALLVGGIKPHYYCLPILKRETHRLALLQAATSGSHKFFAGTDSAPHTTDSKESCCGCAGVYTAHAALELYAEAFDSVGKVELLGDFTSRFGAEHYGLEANKGMVTLVKTSMDVPESYRFADPLGGAKAYKFGDLLARGESVTPLRAGSTIMWSVKEEEKTE